MFYLLETIEGTTHIQINEQHKKQNVSSIQG